MVDVADELKRKSAEIGAVICGSGSQRTNSRELPSMSSSRRMSKAMPLPHPSVLSGAEAAKVPTESLRSSTYGRSTAGFQRE
jgi:hypothetical protein